MTVQSWGTGRKDYSENIEYSVEPVIRSYQSQYVYWTEITNLTAGIEEVHTITTGSSYVVIIYDFIFTAPLNALIGLKVEAISTAGVAATIFDDTNFQAVRYKMPTGFPFFYQIKATLKNLSDVTYPTCYFSMNGLYTGEKEYYLTKTG